MKKIVAVVVALVVVLGLGYIPASAKETVALTQTSLVLNVKDKTILKLTGAVSSEVKWKSTNRKIATVTSKGKVKAVKAGTAVIYASYGDNQYGCTVTVEPKKAAEPKVAKTVADNTTIYADLQFDDNWAVLSTGTSNYTSYSAISNGNDRSYSLGIETITLTENIAETQELYNPGNAETYIRTLANSYKKAESVYVSAAVQSYRDFALYKSVVKTDGKYTVYYSTMVNNIQINAILTADDGLEPAEGIEDSVEQILLNAYACGKSWATYDIVD